MRVHNIGVLLVMAALSVAGYAWWTRYRSSAHQSERKEGEGTRKQEPADGRGAAKYSVKQNKSGQEGGHLSRAIAPAESNGIQVETSAVEKGTAPDNAVSNEVLAMQYGSMADAFKCGGLNLQAIKDISDFFVGGAVAVSPRPQPYASLPSGGLPANAVRLLVLPLETDDYLNRAGEMITSDVLRCLPMGMKAFANPRGNYHVTVFHTSRPWDPRPDARLPGGGIDPAVPPAQRRAPTAVELQEELHVMSSIAAASGPPTLELSQVLMADSGTLLMAWTDVGGGTWRIKQRCKESFPGSPTWQPGIIHTSLLRVLTVSPLDDYTRQQIAGKCEEWTARLRGRRWTPAYMWMVHECEFTTIRGSRHKVPFAS